MTQSTSFAQMANNQSISLSSALRANTPPIKGQTTSRKFLTLSIFLLLSFFTTNAWGAYVTYTVSSISAVTTSGTAPDGSGADYSSTYGTKCQLTSDNSMTLTLSGYEGCTITGLTLSMKSNTDKGAGNMSMKIGSTTVASISTAKFNTSSWHGSWSTSYVNVTPSVTATTVGKGEKIVITIAATANSLYCQSFTLTYTPASSFTITAQSNNTNYGTVSVSGTTITASPETGYRVKSGDAGYTVTSGTADVTNNGDNTFSVTPSSDCTITINFEAIPKYTVTWKVNGEEYETTQVTEGSKPTFPATPSSCDATSNTFYGWATATWDGKINDVSAKIIYTSANDMPAVNGAVTYYAVFAVAITTGGGGSSNYEKVTSNLTDWAGDYLIAYNNTTFANGSTGGTSGMGAQNAKVDLSSSISNNTIPASVGDQYNVTLEAVSGGYVLKTKDGKYNYQSSNESGLATTTDIATATKYAINVTFTSENDIKLALSGNANGAVFRYNTSGYFRFYKNGGQSAVYLYKKVAGGSTTYDNYITTCAADPCASLQAPNVTATATANSITLSWDAVPGATSYNVYNYTTEEAEETTNLTYTFNGLDPETEYEWEVEAVSATCNGKGTKGTTTTSATPCEQLGAATGLTVVTDFVQDGQTYVKFSWTPADNTKANATNQKICFGKVDEAGTCVDNLAKNQTWTSDLKSKLEPGEYWWSIQALGDGVNYCDGDVVNGTNFTIEAPTYTVTFNAGSGICDDESLTETSGGAGVTLPTANPPAACATDSWEFAGWWTEAVAETTTSPGELLTAGSNYKPASDCTLYAVYSKIEGGGGEELSQTLQYDTWSYSGTTTDKGTSSPAYRLFHSGSYVQSASFDLSTLTKVIVYGGTFGGDSYNQLTIGDGTNTWKSVTVSGNSQTAANTYTDGTTLSGMGSLRVTSNSGSSNSSGVRISKIEIYTIGSTTIYNSNPKCCTQPKTLLTIKADQTELVKSGMVTLTATGGNGTDITWTATGGVLSNQSNTGATLTISDVDATQNITVTATQAENNNDDEVVYCAQEASIDITVKAQWTITFQTNDNGVKNSNSILVTDGESYTMPDISDEYVCNSGSSFAGWVDNEGDTELDATPNSTQTATADQTWYAAWSSSSTTKSVYIYQLVTDVTNLTAGDEVWITNTTPTVAMGVQNDNNRGQVTVTKHPTESDKIYSTGSPAILTIGKDGTNYTFHDGTGYLYAASSSKNYLRRQETNNDNGKWSITIEDGKATITAQGTNTHNKLKYNSSSSIFSCYESGQGDVRIYKNVGTAEIEVSGASITTNNTSCHRGAVISAENGKWITSSKGQKVRIAINVTARGFESDATLSATSANEHFSVVSITNTTITKNSAFETQMMIEYQPAEANTNENAEITLVAKKGEEVVATRTIDVNGRSLPDEFVIVAQYNDKWLAVPANMQSGADQYNGIEVTPNNALTQIPAAPSTTIYSLRGVADSRYEAAGNCVRLVGNGNKCLWGNAATTNTTIQNWTTLGATNGSNYEWLLTTSDGELYTIANPAHPDYNQGRILSNSGSKYGLYKGTTKFYILPVGCSSLPGNIQVTARRVDATFSWEGNASSMKIDVYTNEDMTEGNISNTATASPYYMTGLAESTQYWFKMTPNGTDDACAYTGSFKTTGPTIDVVEWQENAAVIFVDKDEELNPLVIIDGEVEHGVGTGSQATELFFSKYFEAHAENKLLAIYNGTANTIDLTGYVIRQENAELDLALYGKTKGYIAPNEEIILVYFDATYSAESCAEQQDNYETWNVLNDKSVLAFSGRGSIGLYKNDVLIDVIGSTFPSGELTKIGKSGSPDNCGTEEDVRLYVDGFSVNDQSSFFCHNGDNIKTPEVENDYAISTNRCLLIRKNSVTSGANAVANNKADDDATCGYLSTTFTTLCSEWSGFRIGGGKSSNEEIKDATCDGLGYVGGFDYNQYYKEYSNIENDTYLEEYTHDDATKEYTIPIDNLAQYSCLNLRFQLKQGDQVLTEEPVQVPIIVSGEKATNDAIFNAIVKTDGDLPVYDQSIERCKTCNVVVLSDATLTKADDGATNDVAEVYNMKVYPGGQVVVPASTNYTVNSLAFRRQEDEVSMANIQGTLNVKHANGVYLDVRIDPSNWHYMTLPYDCRVGDVTFADGTPAVVNTDYLLGWYDGAYRAEHKTGGWTYITDNDYILKKGLGYIVALPGDGKVRREIRFPMANDVIAEDLTGKTVSGLYAYGGDKTDAELRPNHKGWNMIGSPYLYTYTTDIVKEPLQMGTLVHSPVNPWDGTWVRTDDARYIVEPIDNGWSGYRQTTISNLKPFTSYFIQVGGELENGEYTTITPETEQQIVFAANSVARNASAPRKVAEAEVTDNHPVWYGVEMIAPNNEKDNTTLLISNEFTDGYDMMDDLVKMRGDYYQYYNFPVLASRNDEGEMAFNALPDSTAAKIGVPLNYYAATAGTYTIATDGKFDLEEVKAAMLYDATTAQYTNLLTDNYSFTTNKGNNTNRFTLFVTVERKKVPNITTGMDNLLANGQLSLIAIERTLVLSGLTENADIYVYDMNGKLITGTHTAGDNGVWRTIVPATGVYFVRVNSANNQQTLRTIVK